MAHVPLSAESGFCDSTLDEGPSLRTPDSRNAEISFWVIDGLDHSLINVFDQIKISRMRESKYSLLHSLDPRNAKISPELIYSPDSSWVNDHDYVEISCIVILCSLTL
jgi:hypothetical protein